MFFYMPTKVYQEKDAVIGRADEWTCLGARALIVTGRSSARTNGSLGDVIEALTSNGKDYAIFDEIEDNQLDEDIDGNNEGNGLLSTAFIPLLKLFAIAPKSAF